MNFWKLCWLLKAAALALSLAGCFAPRPDGPVIPRPDKPDVVKPMDRAALCTEIAAQIDAKNIDTTDELVRVFQLLADGGHWSQADGQAVNTVLPGLTTAKRALTADDAAKLRQVK